LSDATCLTCKWCDPADANNGVCRYDTPKSAAVMSAQGPGSMTMWPTVRLLHDRCSRYEVELVKPARFVPKLMPLEPAKN